MTTGHLLLFQFHRSFPPSTPCFQTVTDVPVILPQPGSTILVSAKINGAGPITLILDTGSDRTLVAPSALSNPGISIENTIKGILKGVTGMSYADAIWVNSVEVGDVRVGPF